MTLELGRAGLAPQLGRSGIRKIPTLKCAAAIALVEDMALLRAFPFAFVSRLPLLTLHPLCPLFRNVVLW